MHSALFFAQPPPAWCHLPAPQQAIEIIEIEVGAEGVNPSGNRAQGGSRGFRGSRGGGGEVWVGDPHRGTRNALSPSPRQPLCTPPPHTQKKESHLCPPQPQQGNGEGLVGMHSPSPAAQRQTAGRVSGTYQGMVISITPRTMSFRELRSECGRVPCASRAPAWARLSGQCALDVFQHMVYELRTCSPFCWPLRSYK